jgi:hypothetical protein
MLRGSRDFAGHGAYQTFLRQLMAGRNANRKKRFAEEAAVLSSLPVRRREMARRIEARVDSGSTIHVGGNASSLPSRLIGERVDVHVGAETLDVWHGARTIDTLPRLRGRGKHRIESRHVIDWLVRKPGAFEEYRSRDARFPTSRFRMAYDVLKDRRGGRAEGVPGDPPPGSAGGRDRRGRGAAAVARRRARARWRGGGGSPPSRPPAADGDRCVARGRGPDDVRPAPRAGGGP